ncbi:HAD family hydrolase [Streptacidiphilus jiangxiensis]|uniref:Hydrolase of the HAD superfamily n=1 Tax=Streptacidiphilus jiangxiensis TaxID=235985 RepID=A0A1H7NQH6_STRJI|nr:HAD-IA family hydrolase [Streptacidiphilus jiangxiensis]SEL25732.1 Haloacid dehalogenase superfamily, subfamily IA, variant 2 with 3rd motif like haloacid dehalogenase/haloacid dehalogenase superfamily, subfamily IA, variant 3 with third motif having DD or ED/haloacid dehalogenase superfamily, subfamily IA, variant 1 with third motif having Dx(3-4)D or Dx(3-4)E [Streptacidiphilus jiangxiensis]
MIKGVMFDFSGTLFRIESAAQWLRAVVADAGLAVPEGELSACVGRLEEFGAQPGGVPPRRVPAHLEGLWRERDLTAERHRAAFTAMTREAGRPAADLADALYERSQVSEAWQPYPDAEATLRALRGRGIPVAVVSNIGWDMRPVFRDHGVHDLVDAYFLSYECGVKKPDAGIFQMACDKLELAPGDVLMVGDEPIADSGAAALGCRVHLLDPLPVDQRPGALAEVLQLL